MCAQDALEGNESTFLSRHRRNITSVSQHHPQRSFRVPFWHQRVSLTPLRDTGRVRNFCQIKVKVSLHEFRLRTRVIV